MTDERVHSGIIPNTSKILTRGGGGGLKGSFRKASRHELTTRNFYSKVS